MTEPAIVAPAFDEDRKGDDPHVDAVRLPDGVGRRRFVARLLDALAPPVCPVDGSPVGEPGDLGFAAWSRMLWLDDPCCPRCGAPFAEAAAASVQCGACLVDEPAFDAARAAVAFDEASPGLILAFKHGDRTDLAPMFGRWLARAGAPFLEPDAVIAPVRLHWRRLLARRYNQAALLAVALGREAGLEVATRALQRVRPTRPQKDLSADARRRNLSGAIAPSPDAGRRIARRLVILVDDVMTTGATLSACARALRKAGAVSVRAITVSRVVKNGPIHI